MLQTFSFKREWRDFFCVTIYALTVRQRLGAADDSIMDFSRNCWEMDKTPSAIVPRLH